ncbi:hypothetical protein ACFYYH_05450 [Streptomyces sp. NPDC002018]|uniref:hypothetical protein n=1 Tax=Streptomyces sp. NPDC002018 TaxID=3364629 RepID=UPI003680F16B
MYATQAMTHMLPLAKELDENKVTPGVLGFIVFAVMAGGVWLLMKSMNRHMSMVNFEETPEPEKTPAGAPTKTPPHGE